MNLNLVFSKSVNLNLVFLKSMNLNLKIKNKMNVSNQGRRYGGRAKGAIPPLTAACAPILVD